MNIHNLNKPESDKEIDQIITEIASDKKIPSKDEPFKKKPVFVINK